MGRRLTFWWGVYSTCWSPAPRPWCPSLWRPGWTPPGWARWLSEGHLCRLPSDRSHLKHEPSVTPFPLFAPNSRGDVNETGASLPHFTPPRSFGRHLQRVGIIITRSGSSYIPGARIFLFVYSRVIFKGGEAIKYVQLIYSARVINRLVQVLTVNMNRSYTL